MVAMTLLLHPYDDPEPWLEAFSGLLPDMRVELWPEVADLDAVHYVVAWKHPIEELVKYRNLRAVLSTGAGVDQYTGEGMPSVPVVRLADTAMADEMAAYALHWVLHFHRRFDRFAEHQRRAEWVEETVAANADHAVGILGYGTIGRRVGEAFSALGYRVNAWSRSGGDDGAVTHYAGVEGLAAFLGACDSVVNVLPNTAATAHLLSADRFAMFRPGSVLINMGRGATLHEPDLVAALDTGLLRHAVLDVTDVEPLPADPPLWSHPGVHITPHVAGDTRPANAARLIAANIARIEVGEAPFPVYDPSRGY